MFPLNRDLAYVTRLFDLAIQGLSGEKKGRSEHRPAGAASAEHGDGDSAAVGSGAVFVEEEPLPGAEVATAFGDGD